MDQDIINILADIPPVNINGAIDSVVEQLADLNTNFDIPDGAERDSRAANITVRDENENVFRDADNQIITITICHTKIRKLRRGNPNGYKHVFRFGAITTQNVNIPAGTRVVGFPALESALILGRFPVPLLPLPAAEEDELDEHGNDDGFHLDHEQPPPPLPANLPPAPAAAEEDEFGGQDNDDPFNPEDEQLVVHGNDDEGIEGGDDQGGGGAAVVAVEQPVPLVPPPQQPVIPDIPREQREQIEAVYNNMVIFGSGSVTGSFPY